MKIVHRLIYSLGVLTLILMFCYAALLGYREYAYYTAYKNWTPLLEVCSCGLIQDDVYGPVIVKINTINKGMGVYKASVYMIDDQDYSKLRVFDLELDGFSLEDETFPTPCDVLDDSTTTI